MKPFNIFFRLVRLPNLLIIIATQAIIYFLLIQFYADKYSVRMKLESQEIWLFILIVTLGALGGYIINEYYDQDIDKVNRPEQLVVGNQISPKNANRLYILVIATTLILLLAWGIQTKLWGIVGIVILSNALLYFYSSYFKRWFLIGNLVVAVLCALVPILIVLIESDTIMGIAFENAPIALWVGGIIASYSFFAFGTSLFREIVKDIEDIPGDKAVGCTTMPILLGVVTTKFIAISIGTLLLISIIGWLIFQWQYDDLVNKLFVILGLILPLFIALLRLSRARSVIDFRKASNAIKLLMINGLIYLLILKTIIPT